MEDIVNDGSSKLIAYVKPPIDERSSNVSKKQMRTLKEENAINMSTINHVESSGSKGVSLEIPTTSKKKKRFEKALSLEELAKGSIVFKKGVPCTCQARRHKLVSNCLSCGKIVCEQEGEGPCRFCGALVLQEGSTYAGIEGTEVYDTEKESNAVAFAKRLVDYDRNSAPRTKIFDDQSDYYEMDGNTWLSKEEKDRLTKEKKEIEESREVQKNKLIVTFDLIGRKVVVNENEASEMGSEYKILRPAEKGEFCRIKPNPSAQVQPRFIDPDPLRNISRGKQTRFRNGLCLEITGRVQHDVNNDKSIKSSE